MGRMLAVQRLKSIFSKLRHVGLLLGWELVTKMSLLGYWTCWTDSRGSGITVCPMGGKLGVLGIVVENELTRSTQPFNAAYQWPNTTDNFNIVDPTITELNSYMGGAFQQAISGVTDTSEYIGL